MALDFARAQFAPRTYVLVDTPQALTDGSSVQFLVDTSDSGAGGACSFDVGLSVASGTPTVTAQFRGGNVKRSSPDEYPVLEYDPAELPDLTALAVGTDVEKVFKADATCCNFVILELSVTGTDISIDYVVAKVVPNG